MANELDSVLVTLRDQGIPLPAGAILISPWVDLTHSFPSVSGDCSLDFIPSHGFLHRPSPAWPPPNSDDVLVLAEAVEDLKDEGRALDATDDDVMKGFRIDLTPAQTSSRNASSATGSRDRNGSGENRMPGSGRNLSILLDEKLMEIKDQVQMYTPNDLLSHPLVSPVLQPSLGGLPPLLILTGGGEILRDEQIYLAHKAADPAKYPPSDAYLDGDPLAHCKDEIKKWEPTNVQLQVVFYFP
jgi:acetyl esterase/lipase